MCLEVTISLVFHTLDNCLIKLFDEFLCNVEKFSGIDDKGVFIALSEVQNLYNFFLLIFGFITMILSNGKAYWVYRMLELVTIYAKKYFRIIYLH